MKILRVLLLAPLMFSLLIARAAPAATADPDFVIVRTVAGPNGASEVSVQITGTVYQQRAGTLVLGTALGLNIGGYKGGLIQAQDFLGVGTTVGTSDSYGGVFLSIATPVSLLYSVTGGGTLHSAIAPGDRFDVVLFFPNGGIKSSNYSVSAGSGSVTATKSLGYGSKTLDVSQAGDKGRSVAVNGIAYGSQTHQESTTSGIAGTIIDNCDSCSGTWTTPDGTSRDWQSSPDPNWPAFHVFAGPSGAWTWKWQGDQLDLLESSATYGAYFPTGDDWAMFRSGSGS